METPSRVEEIVLAIGHGRNRELLRDWLGPAFTVRTELPDEPGEIGCIVVDEEGLEGHISALRSLREGAAPVILPVLFVARDTDRIPEEVWQLTDEIVTTPIQKSVLRNRLETLLRMREQSLHIKGQQERSERRFRQLFRTAQDPVLIVDDEGTIVDANDSFVSMVEIPHSELKGENVLHIGFEPAETIERILLRVEDTSQPTDKTVRFLNSTGETSISELNAEVLSHLGDSAERIGMFRNVTEREESRKGLERKIHRLDEFSNIVSHDLRNPLTIAMGKLGMIREQCDVEELDDVARSLERMDDLIQNLLDFARAGTMVTEPSVVNLERVTMDSFDLTEESEAVTLDIDTSSSVYGDEEQIRRIFDNLFRNAIEHCRPPVTIRVGELPDGFYFEDDGPGIPESDRDDVFSPGYTTEDGGSGLGLSIINDIVEAHGWSVNIETGSKGGARFAFRNVDFAESRK